MLRISLEFIKLIIISKIKKNIFKNSKNFDTNLCCLL